VFVRRTRQPRYFIGAQELLKPWNERELKKVENAAIAPAAAPPIKDEKRFEYTMYHQEYLTRSETKHGEFDANFGVVKVFDDIDVQDLKSRGFVILKKSEVNEDE